MGLAGPVWVTALQISGPGAKQRLIEQELDGWVGERANLLQTSNAFAFCRPKFYLALFTE